MTEAPGHRRDIDGLRAIAVGAIVLFHALPQWVPGGFVGVDVFFVISGYLITGIISRDVEAGRLSFAGFYARRARRILPAYIVVTAIVSLLAAWLLLPGALQIYGGDLAASSVFASNFRMWTNASGYFAPDVHERVLVHLWSLAVEEQIYVVWPLVLVALSGAMVRKFRWPAVFLITLASLGLAQGLLRDHPKAAYYLMPGRAWEFLLGGLLVLAPLDRLKPRGVVAEGLAAGGIGLILLSVFFINSATPFPGLAALPPCLGAAMVLLSGQSGQPRMSALLRSAPLVGIGLISYSLYLWHWPVLTFARLILQAPLTPLIALVLILLCGGLAALTWKYVEQPARSNALPPRWKMLVAPLGLAAGLAVLGLTGLALHRTHGLPGRLGADALSAIRAEGDISPRRDACLAHQAFGQLPPLAKCQSEGASGTSPAYDVLILGDSHADALSPAIFEWTRMRGLHARQITQNGCVPLADILPVREGKARPDCTALNAAAMAEARSNPHLKVVFLAARWAKYTPTRPLDPNLVAPRSHWMTALKRASTGSVETLEPGLDRTLAAWAGMPSRPRIVLIGPVPEMPFRPAQCLAERRLLHLPEAGCLGAAAAVVEARLKPAEDMLRRSTALHPGVTLILPREDLCTDVTCASVRGGHILYADDDHMTATGSRVVLGPLLARIAP